MTAAFRLLRRVFPVTSPATLTASSLTFTRAISKDSSSSSGPSKTIIGLKSMFMKRGDPDPFTGMELFNGVKSMIRIRVDMPGACPESLKVERDDKWVRFCGSEDPNKMHGVASFRGGPRTYSSRVEFDPSRFRPFRFFVYQLLDGVLWMQFFGINPNPYTYQTKPFQVETGDGKTETDKLKYNPLVCEGQDRDHIFDCKEDEFVMGVDVPGLHDGESTLTVKEDYKISFRAEQSGIDDHPLEWNTIGRVYEGSVEVDLRVYDANCVKCVIENGVLWIKVPRHSVTPWFNDYLCGGWVRFHDCDNSYIIHLEPPKMGYFKFNT